MEMERDNGRLPPTLEAFQTILSAGIADPAEAIGILNATGITKRTDALFRDADVEDVERLLRAAEQDPAGNHA